MKKWGLLLFTVLLLGGVSLQGVYANSGYDGTIRFIQQTTEKSALTVTDGNEPLGMPASRGVAADYSKIFFGIPLDKYYFVGWSAEPDYEQTPGSKLYYSHQTIAEMFPDGIDGEKKVYAVYTSMMGMGGNISKNKIYFAEDVHETLPGAELSEEAFSAERSATIFYEDTKESNPLCLKANFQMDRMMAHWLYVGNGHTIMTNTQGDIGDPKVGARYTHVDLHVDLPEEVEMPEELTLTFSSYTFQPYMVIDADTRDRLNEKTTNDWNLTSFASDTRPETTWTILNPNKSRNLILRTIVRTNGHLNGKPIAGVRAEDIESYEMFYKSDGAFIPKEKVLEHLAAPSPSIQIGGHVDGFVVLPRMGFFDLARSIEKMDVPTPIKLKFIMPIQIKYDANLGSSAPVDNKHYKLKDNITVLGGALRAGYEFAGWNTQADGAGVTYQAGDILTLTRDTTLYAMWRPASAAGGGSGATGSGGATTSLVRPDNDTPINPEAVPTQGLESERPKLNSTDHFAYMYGYPDGSFGATRPMTRAEVAVMFYRLLEERPSEILTSSNGFSDVKMTSWYYKPVSFMASKGIVGGYPDKTFRPNQAVTRAEFSAIASRFEQLTSGAGQSFRDVSGNHWAAMYIHSAAAKGWVSGYPDNRFMPNRQITRAEVVSVTNRMLYRQADAAFVRDNKESIKAFYDVPSNYWAYLDIMEATNGHNYTRIENNAELWSELNGKEFR